MDTQSLINGLMGKGSGGLGASWNLPSYGPQNMKMPWAQQIGQQQNNSTTPAFNQMAGQSPDYQQLNNSSQPQIDPTQPMQQPMSQPGQSPFGMPTQVAPQQPQQIGGMSGPGIFSGPPAPVSPQPITASLGLGHFNIARSSPFF